MIREGLNMETKKFIGHSPVFLDLLEQAGRLKGRCANVLITGESGTGKELLAKHIHDLESNPSRPFIAVNCAAIPENLLEAELFGHEKGSFTSAVDRKIGKFEMADGGDIFLDEISTLKPDLQAKLLRVLQEKTIYRIGGQSPIKLHFRVIAATNEPLSELQSNSKFRLDLYHRLAIVTLNMPPLRKRCEDIPSLAEYFLKKYSSQNDQKTISNAAMQILCKYDWPGNIRELENFIHTLTIMVPHQTIETRDIRQLLTEKAGAVANEIENAFVDSSDIMTQSLEDYLEWHKKNYIKNVLEKNSWNYTKTSKELGISRITLHKHAKTINVDEISFIA